MDRDAHFICVGAGWQPLVAELDAALKARWPDYTVAQVKEKFGTLRFYAYPGLPDVEPTGDPAGDADLAEQRAQESRDFHALIHAAEQRSAGICEECGSPGRLGRVGHWLSTRCPACSPSAWTSVEDDLEDQCQHSTIVDGSCQECGLTRIARLEHAPGLLSRTHPAGTCLGEWCTIHNRSDHPMRAFPQHWRADRGLMERLCPHGIGHPDPDDARLSGPSGAAESVHGCDGCCSGAYR